VVVLVGFQKRPSAIFPGTKLGGILPLRKRRKGISFLLGGFVGCKMLQKAGKVVLVFASITKAYHFCLAGLLAPKCCRKLEKLKLKCLEILVWIQKGRDVRHFLGFLLLCFEHEIRYFAASASSQASQRHIISAWWPCSLEDVAESWKS
jgi:hypothetical protein